MIQMEALNYMENKPSIKPSSQGRGEVRSEKTMKISDVHKDYVESVEWHGQWQRWAKAEAMQKMNKSLESTIAGKYLVYARQRRSKQLNE